MISYIELGGTLFIPATHKNLEAIVSGEKYSTLKSVLIDTEDSISDAELTEALQSVKSLLSRYQKTKLLVFIRPRNQEVLQELLAYTNIEKIDGFILPKFSLENAESYLELLKNTKHCLMPSIEGKELFDGSKLIKLRDILLHHSNRIILIRFGLEDMLRQLTMRRKCEDSIFDFSVTHTILGNFIAIFKSAGFSISGGVYPCFKNTKGFEKDVLRDLKEGLFSKTIIHPNQIELINELYKVEKKDLDEALAVIHSSKEVFNQSGKMAEKITMLNYSQFIVQRAEKYGVK